MRPSPKRRGLHRPAWALRLGTALVLAASCGTPASAPPGDGDNGFGAGGHVPYCPTSDAVPAVTGYQCIPVPPGRPAPIQWWTRPFSWSPGYFGTCGGADYDDDLAVVSGSTLVLPHDSEYLGQNSCYTSGCYQSCSGAWGYGPNFRDMVTGINFHFNHLKPEFQPIDDATAVGTVFKAGSFIGVSGGDTCETGYCNGVITACGGGAVSASCPRDDGTWDSCATHDSTGYHLCVVTTTANVQAVFGSGPVPTCSSVVVRHHTSVDLDGDGRADLCGRGSDGIHCALSTGSGFAPDSQWSTGYANVYGWTNPIYWGTIQFPDLNGDGRADLCGRGGDGVWCALSTGAGFSPPGANRWTTSFSDALGWGSDPSYWGTLQFPDVDGDGRADVCGRAGDGVHCGLSTGTSFQSTSSWSTGFADATGWTGPAYWGTLQFPDVNGDGRADVCGRGSDGIWCAVSTGLGFAPAGATRWTTSFSDALGWASDPSYWGTIQFPDVNGDGRADVCGRAGDGIHCALSTGSSFQSDSRWSTGFTDAYGWTNPVYWGTIRFPDLDGDGRADLCGRGGNGIWCALSTGAGFAPAGASVWTTGYADMYGWANQSWWGTIAFPDVDGDGRADVCGRGGDGVWCGLSTGTAFAPAGASRWTTGFSDTLGWGSDPSYWGTLQYP